MESLEYEAIVIGGGFFGCRVAMELKKSLNKVLVIEKEADILQRASYVNQARVHNGYHYPRSILTALRSRVNFSRFVDEYRDCTISSFDKYYAIGKIVSKVTANQFERFCKLISAPIIPASKEIRKLFDLTLIENVFLVQEYAFDAVKLKCKVLNELEDRKIRLKLNSEVIKLQDNPKGGIEVFTKSENNYNKLTSKYVFNCTYSAINKIFLNSDLPIVPLKHELTEMALVEVPEPLSHVGITVMCGPFFSIMPFPARGLHTLSHVRYTPHYYWQDTEDFSINSDNNFNKIANKTNYIHMIRDAQRYMPILKDCRYVDSIWEVKTVLPQSEQDDSRPILFKRNHGLSNLTCILGGKIDNVYDISDELQLLNNKGGMS